MSGAFSNCLHLSSITIPESVMYIGIQAFDVCSSLADVYFESYLPTTIFNDSFRSTNFDLKLWVYNDSYIEYFTHPSWTIYSEIIEVVD